MFNNYVQRYIDFAKTHEGVKSWEDIVSYSWYKYSLYLEYLTAINMDFEHEYYASMLNEIVKNFFFAKYKYRKYTIYDFVKDFVRFHKNITYVYELGVEELSYYEETLEKAIELF